MLLFNCAGTALHAIFTTGNSALVAADGNGQLPSRHDYNAEVKSTYVCNGEVEIKVLVQGQGPAFVILPSYGRDSVEDFGSFSTAIAEQGYAVLRTQPRGAEGSSGLLVNVTLEDLAADVARVIDVLTSGKAFVLGHAFGQFPARQLAVLYPEKVPAVISCSGGALTDIPSDVNNSPFVAGNYSNPTSVRLAALELGFFAPGNNASVWLPGWHPGTLRMERSALERDGTAASAVELCGADNTLILDVVPAEDTFRPRASWNQTIDQCPDRAVLQIVQDAGHALFPEQPQGVLNAIISWLKEHYPAQIITEASSHQSA